MYEKYLVFDTETELFAPGPGAPPPKFVVGGVLTDEGTYKVYDNALVLQQLLINYANLGYTLIGHNLTFDLEVLGIKPRPEHKYHDTMLADMLLRLVENDGDRDRGKTLSFRSLESCYGRPMAGKGTTQKSFLAGRELTEEQLRYLKKDVVATLDVAVKQFKRGLPGGLGELNLQLRACMALNQLTRNGLHVDLAEVSHQRAAWQKRRKLAAAALTVGQFYTPESKGPRGGIRKAHRNMEPFRAHVQAVAEELDVPLKHTAKGAVATNKEFLLELQQDEYCKAWLEYSDADKMVGTFLDTWAASDGVIHPTYNLMVRTGRTSCRSPNLQQVPSRGPRGKVKSVFVAPPGRQLVELDYCQLELSCLAYLTQGRMKFLINEGRDLHRDLGAIYFDKDAELVTKEERQLMKCANFGLPGGMGPNKFRSFIRTNGLPDPGDAAARDLINAWHEAYPEMQKWLRDDVDISKYFRWTWAGRAEEYSIRESIQEQAWCEAWNRVQCLPNKMPGRLYRELSNRVGSPSLERWLTHREVTVRGGRRRRPVTYTEQRNTRFQGIAANLAKDALARIVFDLPDVWCHAFVHDSVLVSITDKDQIEAVARKMLDAADHWLPGVVVKVEACGPGRSWYDAKTGEVNVF